MNGLLDAILKMSQYKVQDLENMTLDELIEAQRSVLLPHERELFDREESLVLKKGDPRDDFLDYTDRLICRKYA